MFGHRQYFNRLRFAPCIAYVAGGFLVCFFFFSLNRKRQNTPKRPTATQATLFKVIRIPRNLANFCLWDPKSWVMETGIQLKPSGIPLAIVVRNPISANKESGIQLLVSWIHLVQSRILAWWVEKKTMPIPEPLLTLESPPRMSYSTYDHMLLFVQLL